MTNHGRTCSSEQGGEGPCYAHLLDPLTDMSVSPRAEDLTEPADADTRADLDGGGTKRRTGTDTRK